MPASCCDPSSPTRTGSIETLGQRLRKEGRLHVDLLQRFGEDLLDIVNYLEEQGIPHRDIKPDNIAVGMLGRGDKLHLVLFDFSLSRTPAENIQAGTNGYLDPLLPLRKPRWDLHAERYAAAVTLFELATGVLPKWGDGSNGTVAAQPANRDHHRRGAVRRQLAGAPDRSSRKRFGATSASGSTTPRRCGEPGGTLRGHRRAWQVL